MRRSALFLCLPLLLGASAPPEPAPGEGVLCALALLSAADEVGRRCFPGQNPGFQNELAHSVQRLDGYVLANSDTTPELLAEFKAKQGLVGTPAEKLCRTDAVMIYQATEKNGLDKLRAGIDALVSRPGKPAWGDCL